MSRGLIAMGSNGSVNSTLLGTVSIIRARMSLQLSWNAVAFASAFMVTFPSAANTLVSELVSSGPTTSGLDVLPWRYPETTTSSKESVSSNLVVCVALSFPVISGNSEL